MVPTDMQHTPEIINNTLREVLAHYVGQSVVLAIHDYGARKRSGLEGTITEATASGVLLTRAHGGREFISYMDIYAGHIEVKSPATLAEDMADALGHLGVHHRDHKLGRQGVPQLPVAKGREGFHHVKTLVG